MSSSGLFLYLLKQKKQYKLYIYITYAK